MRNKIYVLLVLFLFISCSSKKAEQPVETAEERGYSKEQEAPGAIPENKAEETPIKNTTSYHTVVIRQMKFEPTELKLHKGDTVLWINKDITDHDITEEVGKQWSSSKIAMNKSWSMVVNESADYYCSIHVVMKGKLLVD